MRIASGFLAVLFAGAAVVQVNDPDPLLWMVIYGAGAVCSGLYAVGIRAVRLSAVVSGACGLGALVLMICLVEAGTFLDETGTEMTGVVEEGREMMGLLIMAVWTGGLAWWEHTVHSRPEERPDWIEFVGDTLVRL
jgi:amino acid transporter